MGLRLQGCNFRPDSFTPRLVLDACPPSPIHQAEQIQTEYRALAKQLHPDRAGRAPQATATANESTANADPPAAAGEGSDRRGVGPTSGPRRLSPLVRVATAAAQPRENSAEAFQRVQTAYDVLSDPKRKAGYDKWLAAGLTIPYEEWLRIGGATSVSAAAPLSGNFRDICAHALLSLLSCPGAWPPSAVASQRAAQVTMVPFPKS